MSASASIQSLRGVGPKVLARLEALGIRQVEDLWFFLPRSYEDRTALTPISALRHGMSAQVVGSVRAAEKSFRYQASLRILIEDEHGNALTLRFFHFRQVQVNAFRAGTRVLAYGVARQSAAGFEMSHPSYRILLKDETVVLSDRLDPVYPVIEGIGAVSFRKWVLQSLHRIAANATLELLPDHILQALSLPPLRDALLTVHQPSQDVDLRALQQGVHPAQQRLAFEELLAHQLSLRRQRQTHQSHAATPLRGRTLVQQLLTRLPFALTAAQARVFDEIANDLAQPHPMLRLVQGDVGSGKTVVAALACLLAIGQGKQAAIMAPTELLAEQHLRTLQSWLQELGIRVAWLAGKVTGKARSKVLADIASGEAQLIVGTHALMQEAVIYKDLALVVVDEQHRFGVHQRLALRDKARGNNDLVAHQLVMTATPIPRTLAMSAYADLDVSAIDELPPGRTPVRTIVMANDKRSELIARMDQACADGRQVYWVCTLIDDNEEIAAQAAQTTYESLQKALPRRRIGLVHGRMKAAEKQQLMQDFHAHKLDVLVATTVIEVGVDVPNASLMVVENAERLGLAQLHQLRGRVGRGSAISDCVLMYQMPLSQMAKARLQTMRETNDGFVIAEKDLQLRGPGEILGTRQTGITSFRFADLLRDAHLLPKVQHTASQLLQDDVPVVDALLQRWIGDALRYVDA